MPHKIYVGNYPMSFGEDDVLHLFQDFEGIELVGFFKNKNKCYSFLHCMNERQMLEVIVHLHDIDVGGRNLIVRAADQNLQKKIQKSMLEKGVMGVNVHPKNTCDINNSTSSFGNNETYRYSEPRQLNQSGMPQAVTSDSKIVYPKKYEMVNSAGHSTIPNSYNNAKRKPNSNKYENHNSSPHFPENYSPQLNSHSALTHLNGAREKCASSYSPNDYESEGDKSGLCINPQETFTKSPASAHYKTMNERFESYQKKSLYNREGPTSSGHQANNSIQEQYKPRYRNISESSLETVHNVPPLQKYEKLSFVSVMNFPLRMPVKDLYKLFSDFNPIKVFMVCNEPGMERTPTEAIICFESDEDATKAILTLDNTVYRGRVLLVTDAVDMSLVTELLSFV